MKVTVIIKKIEIYNTDDIKLPKNKWIIHSTQTYTDNVELLFALSEPKAKYWVINVAMSTGSITKVKDLQIVNGIKQLPYEPYKEDKKEILLNIEGGLKGIDGGAKDTIEMREDGVYVVQLVDKRIINGNEPFNFYKETDTLYGVEVLIDNAYEQSHNTICDKFTTINTGISIAKNDCIMVGGGTGRLYILISKNKLSESSVQGVKDWLQVNPLTVYYRIKNPIENKILDINSINLETFKDVTHVFSENAIAPNLSFKAPIDVPATISTLRTRNENLEQENKELKEEVDIKTLKLHGQDVELTNSDLDLDFRIFELEMSMGLPINLNMKGMRNMARSPFEMMKILILNNNYDREDIEYKASRYLKGGRMTQTEYNEIISLMDANELVK